MKCAACTHENRDGARFCQECAAPLKRVCASCGAELGPTAKFCDECAAPTGLTPPSATQPKRPAEPAGARKVVTTVFADLIGSTALHERVDAESVRRLMERYYDALRAAVEAHGGTVVKLLGDGVMAAFGVPQVAEDDALRAVRAGVVMQEAFRALVGQQAAAFGDVGLRVAVNTGEVVVSGGIDDVVGDPVNVAARLQQEAGDGDVVIGEATQRLVGSLVTLEPLGSFSLKGRAESVRAYRVVSLERPAGASATPFVGREAELARLASVYESAISTPAARLAVLLGSPGLGKSRLIEEFSHRQSDSTTIIFAHCDAAGGATFAPVAEALREVLHIDDGASGEALRTAVDAGTPASATDRARIVDGITALLAGSPAAPEETFFVVRRLLAALAGVRPVVLVIDDFQWAEPLLLDLVEHLVQWGSGVRLLVLVGARPELRDTRSSLVTPGGLVADVMTLAGLDAGAAMRLAANVIGATDLPAAVAAKVLATSEGNPLFVAELVRMMVQEGALERQGDRWTIGAGLDELEMPPTIHALLAARIERLRPDERIVLERASVVGRHFSRSAVAELLPRDVADLDARLESLRRSELIERDTGWFLGEPVLRFHHMLTRDAAYRRVLKGTRAELHARFADWIEARVGDSVEHDETIGWHLEQAHQHLGELGPIDEQGRALGERASRYLAAAGRRALARDDLPLAASLLGRALDRLDANDSSRADLALDWCEALLASGDVGPAAAAIDELGRFMADSERLRAWHTCFAGQLTVFTAPQALHAATQAVAAAAETLTKLGDATGEAKAHFVHAQALARLGKGGACEAALDRALAAARRAGDRRRANAVLAGAPLAALWGPSPVTRASGRCLDVVRVLRITQGAPAVEAVAVSCQGVLEALRGRTDAARRMIASSRKMVEELGITHRLLEADVFAGQIDLLEGDPAAAERSLRGAYEGLRDLGLGIDAAQAAALLARALLAQGRAAEAETLSHESEALAGDDLKAAIAWRGVRAEALARRGEHARAVELAEAAVAIASATDALLDHADARLALAAALRAAGRSTDADAEDRRATGLWMAKGATRLVERGQRGVARVEVPPDAREARIESPGRARRRVRSNAATAEAARLDAAVAARDPNALHELFAEDLEVDDHTTGIVFDRQGALSSFGYLISARNPTCRSEPMATLGDALAICHFSASASGVGRGRLDVGAYEKEEIHLNEVDAEGRRRRGEVFATDHLNEAIARLYERYAELLPEGVARTRAATTARVVATTMRKDGDAERWRTACTSDAEMIDNRQLGTWNARGADAIVEQMGSLRDVADGIDLRTLEILDLEPDALLVRRMHSGTERVGGGTYERPLLLLLARGTDGRVTRVEFFDDDAEAAALARFDELVGSTSTDLPVQTSARFANAATRLNERIARAWNARDWDAVMALHAPTGLMDDRRRLMHMQVSGERSFAQLRILFDVPGSHWEMTPVATRGERLALSRLLFAGNVDAEGGALAIDYLVVDEVDADGLSIAVVLFDPDDLDAAYAELDARYEAGEAATLGGVPSRYRAVVDALNRHEWSAFTAIFAPSFRERDHRVLGWGDALSDMATWVRALQALVELSPNVRYRLDHVRESDRAVLSQVAQVGTWEGGAFENFMLVVGEEDEAGRVLCVDSYDVEQFDEAHARFEELRALNRTEPSAAIASPDWPSARTPKPNAADAGLTRWQVLFAEAIANEDWEVFRRICAPGMVFEDRRRLALLAGGYELMFASLRERVAIGARAERHLSGTAGDRIAMSRMLWSGGPADGRFEIEYLCVNEVDEAGQLTAVILFDCDDARAAQREAWARWAAIDPVAAPWVALLTEIVDLWNTHDRARVRAMFADDIVVEDHRHTGLGRVEGADAYTDSIAVLWDLAPDQRIEFGWSWPAYDRHGAVVTLRREGTLADGGAFENDYLWLGLAKGGRFSRLELFEPEDLAAALARFEEIRAETGT
jgi:class 3 adenylate cyclase/tetratricopeptide (TPR) repeat protein